MPVYEQQITPYRIKPAPYPRVNTPFPAVGCVCLLPPFAIESRGNCFHIMPPALFCCDVAVASQSHDITVDTDNSVQDIPSGGRFGENHTSCFYFLYRSEQGFVALVFQERTHAIATQRQYYRVTFVYHPYHFRQQYGIRHLPCIYPDIVLWHSSAASSSGRQCSVYTGTDSIMCVMVSQMLLYMVLSHFIDEHEGSSAANALTGGSLSILFFVARSIFVTAPKRTLMLR